VNALAGIFLAVLVVIHRGDTGYFLAMPLSLMRETSRAGMAYSLFVLMLCIGGFMVRAAVAAGKISEACTYALAMVAVAVAAVTSTWSLLHALAALALIILMCRQVATLVVADESRGLRKLSAYAVIPLLASAGFGYGVGQKGALVYFVLAMAIRCRELWNLHEIRVARSRPRPKARWRCSVASSPGGTP
jgi:hypothetical protein